MKQSRFIVYKDDQKQHDYRTYISLPSAGPPFSTSEMAMEVSPLEKWGLSRPPDTAMPNPQPDTRLRVTWCSSQAIRSPPCTPYGLNMEVYLGSMSRDGHSCTHWLRHRNPPPPLSPALGLIYEGRSPKFIWAPCHVMGTAVLIWLKPLATPTLSPSNWDSQTRALLVSKDRRHLFVSCNPLLHTFNDVVKIIFL